MTTIFRVGAASTGPAGNGTACAREAAEAAVEALARAGAGLAVLPELFALPYVAGEDPAGWAHLAEPLDGPTARWAADLSSRLGIPIVFGMALAGVDGGKPFNAALLARPGGTVEPVAHKIHLPPAGPGERFGEADHFAAGPPCVGTVEVGPVRLAVLICYDRRFPESWRAAAAAGADVVAVLVAGPAPGDPDGIFLAELRTHARANAVYAVAAARFGTETITGSPVRHDGETAAVTPDGGIAAAGPTITIDIDPTRLQAARNSNPTARHLRF
jgi:N-carbamoylputrescine amidase